MKRFLIIICLFLLFGCTVKEDLVLPIGSEDKIAIIGEANSNDTICLKIFYANNKSNSKLWNEDTDTGNFSALGDCDVSINDAKGNSVARLNRKDSITWHSPVVLKEGENYTLTIDNKGVLVKAHTFIPKGFEASYSKITMDDEDKIILTVNDAQGSGYYVVTCPSSYDRYSYVMINSNDIKTDNYIYREISLYSYALFWNKKTNENTLEFFVESNSNYSICVRKVSEQYYRFLYTQHVQGSYSDILPLRISNNDYLGIWGGANSVVIR